jgi:hypothetical protein
VLVTAPDSRKLTVSVSNAGQTVSHVIAMNYQDAGPEEFVKMAKSGETPRDYAYYVKSVELMSKICETAGF